MAESGWVDITHKETGLTSTVLESTVPAWETAGWTRADNGSEEQGQQLSPPFVPGESGQDDPDESDEE